ncbi:MAG: aminopeptidase [Elusimicrobiota bacterium]|jgi:aminopeptidase|nr:aminopeptidase [Elusimicrobiota bacterium]
MDLNKYANVLIHALKTARRGGKFKRGDNILISYDILALPLAEAVYALLVEQGYNAAQRPYATENMSKAFYKAASDAQLKHQPPWDKVLNENLNGLIALRAPRDLTALKGVDSKRIALAALARKPLREILDKREEAGLFGWTLANMPTPEMAKQARLSPKEYEAQITKACFLNEADPIKKFDEVARGIAQAAKWLSGLPIDTIRTQSKDMDLEITLGDKRKFIGGGGCNVPSFEIFTSPDWRGARGVYYSDLPSFRSGNYVRGIRLEFKAGRVVKIQAQEGLDFVKKMLAMDAGAARLGEYSLTDTRFSKIDRFMADTLYDENFGGRHGNCHVALGASYSDTFTGALSKMDKAAKKRLGFNQSALHWDLVNTQDKLVTAKLKDGRHMTIYEKGRFKI